MWYWCKIVFLLNDYKFQLKTAGTQELGKV